MTVETNSGCTLVDRDDVRSIWHDITLRQRLVDAVIENVVEANRRVCFLGSGKIRVERVESEPCNSIFSRPPKTDTHNPFFVVGSAKLVAWTHGLRDRSHPWTNCQWRCSSNLMAIERSETRLKRNDGRKAG